MPNGNRLVNCSLLTTYGVYVFQTLDPTPRLPANRRFWKFTLLN